MTVKTLADYTSTERATMIGMWADYDGTQVIICAVGISATVLDPATGQLLGPLWPSHFSPLWDLPRAWTPDGQPVPGKWDDDNGHNLMRRFRTEWEWKQEVSQDFIDQYEGRKK